MNIWTDEQLIIVIKSASVADSGCCYCIKDVLEKFLEETDWSLLERMDKLNDVIDFDCYDWKDVRPRNWER